MRLPAIAIAAVFVLGIVFGLAPPVAPYAASRIFLAALLGVAVASLLAGMLLVYAKQFAAAAVASLACWMLLGVAGACLDEQPRCADYILNLAAADKVHLKTPLRYLGRLRDEPAKLAWGLNYEIELSGVEIDGSEIPVSGGLRLSYVPRATRRGAPIVAQNANGQADEHVERSSAAVAPPEVHVGDIVAVLTQPRLPSVYRDEGAFDRRAFLVRQNIDVIATLRAPELLEVVQRGHSSINARVSRVRRRLRDKIDELLESQTSVAGVLRAMLLGDKSFVDRDESTDFQKTGTFHVLVVAGLHVAAFALLISWIGRLLRLPQLATAAFTLMMMFGYVCVVEQRAPVLRAALMAAIVVVGRIFFRRLDLLNTVAVAATILLAARPSMISDSSFQFSFLAIACIAGLGSPWLQCTVQPYALALQGWRDVTRDVSHKPGQAQFRIDVRLAARAVENRLPSRIAKPASSSLVLGLSGAFRLWELFALTSVLQFGMLPLFAREFHRITLAGPVVNFAAVPLTALIVPLGFLTLLGGFLSAPFGHLLAIPLSWLTMLLIHIVQWFAHFPQLSYRIPGAPLWITVVFLIALTGLMVCLRVQFAARKLVLPGLGVVLASGALLITTSPFPGRTSPGKLELTVLDVGQGDSLFVVSPHGRTMLIDGGGAFNGFPGQPQQRGIDPGEEAVSPYLWSRGFKRIDVVAVSHAHQDHLGGLMAIFENFRVGLLWIGREANAPALAKLEALAIKHKIPVEHESRGQRFSLDGANGEFLWPEIPVDIAEMVPARLSSQAPANASAKDSANYGLPAPKNNDSLVMRLQYGDRSLLLPGDAEKQAEHAILLENTAESLHSDVLKIGHHGSKNSTTLEFLNAVRPQVAVISAGENNPYGHPSPELIERLNAAGVRILRTDRDGAVHILTDGNRLEISCFVACPEPPVAATGSVTAETPGGHQNDQQQ